MPRKPRPMIEQLRTAIAKAEKGGVTRYQIAQRSGLSQSTLLKIMAGSVPRLDTAEKIAAAIGCRLTLDSGDA